MDILQREGKYPVAVNVSPILGVEISGVVESVGKDGKYNIYDRFYLTDNSIYFLSQGFQGW